MGLVGRFVVSFRPIMCDMLFGPLLTLFAVVVPTFGEHGRDAFLYEREMVGAIEHPVISVGVGHDVTVVFLR